ncbi:MAG: sortase [Anaerolineae bacterium]|nr:sortase [Anaerolineae bacterium]
MTSHFQIKFQAHRRAKTFGLALATSVLVGCGGAAPTPAPTVAPSQVQVNFAPTATAVPAQLPTQVAQPTAAPTQAPPTAAPKPTSAPTTAPTAAASGTSNMPAPQGNTANTKPMFPEPGKPAFERPTHIVIPAIKVDAPIAESSLIINKQGQPEWDLPKGRVAAWHNNSSLLGQPGNLVLNGHNNIEGSIFAGLYDLKPGDKVILRNKNREITYELSYYKLLKEKDQPISALIENAKYIEPTPDDRITLVTCWPITNNTHRWIWVGKPVDEKILK